MIFFVSDGAFSVQAAKEQVEIARSHGLNVFGIGICGQSMDEQYKDIFGHGCYTIVDESYKTSSYRLIGDISKYVYHHIRSLV